MSKKLLIASLPILLLLSWCVWSSDQPASTEDNSLSWAQETMTSGTQETLTWVAAPSLDDCKKAAEAHLTDTKTKKLDTTKKVAKNSLIVVDYVGRLSDGTVFDTSVESVAKACGLYTAQRNYTAWLEFTAGTQQMIAGFDEWVIGMAINETKTINILSKDAYGWATVSYPISQLPPKPDGSPYKVGESITTMNGAVKIEALTDKEFTIKNGHPLAGKDLIFDITIKTVK